MKVKRVSARGFKTYRDLVTVNELDSQLNCIVGYNGSGKSSFFQAIVFVLCPHVGSSGSVLHDGNAGRSQTCYVEIEIQAGIEDYAQLESLLPPGHNNSIVLRRTVTQKPGGRSGTEDDFSVNDRAVSRTEYISFLQTVGLLGSTSDASSKRLRLPYYIVEQGRVASIATISDSGRLALLKEASGVDVYVEKRSESLSILEDAKTKRDRVEELLVDIETRCEGLEKESRDLGEYSKLKKLRDFLEFKVYSVEADSLAATRAGLFREGEQLEESIASKQGQIAQLEERSAECGAVLEKLKSTSPEERRTFLESEKLAALHQVAELQLQLDTECAALAEQANLLGTLTAQRPSLVSKKTDLENACNSFRTQISQHSSQLHLLQTRQRELESLKAQVAEEQDLAVSLERTEARISSYQQQIGSAASRLKFIEAEIAGKCEELRILDSEQIPAMKMLVEEAGREVADLESARVSQLQRLSRLETEILKPKQRTLFSKQQEEYGFLKAISEYQKDLGSLSASVFSSSALVRAIVGSDPPAGVLGLFGDFIKIPSVYRKAVEAVAKRVLFHVIIDSDQTADKVSAFLKSKGIKGGGALTLTPVNRIKAARGTVADLTGKNAQLMSSVVVPATDDQWVQQLIHSHFSQVAVVESVELGVEIARTQKIDCVTLDGEIVDKNLIFGSAGGAAPVVRNWQQMLEIRAKFSLAKAEQTRVHAEILQLESELKQVAEEIALLQAVPPADQKKAHYAALRKQLHALDSRKIEIEQFEIPSIQQGELLHTQNELEQLKCDLAAALTKRDAIVSGGLEPSPDSPHSIELIESELATLTGSLIPAVESSISKLSKSLSVSVSELRYFVSPKLDHLDAQIAELQRKTHEASPLLEKQIAHIRESEVARLDREILAMDREIEQWLKGMAEAEKARVACDTDIEVGRSRVRSEEDILSNLKIQIERVTEQLGVVESSLRRIPSVAGDALGDWGSASLTELKTKHMEVSSELSSSPRFEFLNKHALEQYEQIVGDRVSLQARKREIEDSFSSIARLLEELDAKESAQMEAGFQRAKTAFEALFTRVTNGGSANLAMTPEGLRIEHVSFGGNSKNLQQLSGGQRTVVALCFLLSLGGNKFFVLDEVDAALDASYRAGIATAVADLSARKRMQFLFTSFRPEMCAAANKHFLVRMGGGSSWVEQVDKAAAMALVEQEDEEGTLEAPFEEGISARE